MPKPLLIGSANRKKAAELAELLSGSQWTIQSLDEYPEVEAPDESGDSFEDNALIKAQYYAQAFGVDCVADDSGLVVDALDGAPGVYSARYAGNGCTDADNNEKLLMNLEKVPLEKRTARFVCCAAFVAAGEHMRHTETGQVEGCIALECRGKSGFGYDPLFIPLSHEHTFGELDPAIKQRISHRGQAFRKLGAFLRTVS